jgi:hypothetical protein
VKAEGSDSVPCLSYNNALQTLDMDNVLKTKVINTNEIHTIYIDPGTHNYTIISYQC